jgi:tetratricopeptide (TPR) repeat protein
VASTSPALQRAGDLPRKPGVSAAERRTLRRIPALRSLPSGELEEAQARMLLRSYQAGEVMWRTRGPLHFSGYVQSGEIELETRVDGVPVRTTRLCAGDPLPSRALQNRRPHETMIARAVTDVHLAILPELQARPAAREIQRGMNWLWPVLLLLLVVVLARDDIARIVAGLLYQASNREGAAAVQDPRSMGLLEAAQKVDRRAAFAYNEEGYRWFLRNNIPGASSAFQEAIASDPANAPALNNLGITYYSQGKPVQAAGFLQQSMVQDPDNPVARYNLGITLMQLADPAGALRQFQEAGFIDSKDASSLLQQAYLYQQAGDYAHAEQRARSAIQLNPSQAPAHLLLGMALYNQGREADALASFNQALMLEPGNRVAAFYRALILGHQKQYDAALPVLYELLVASPNAGETARILAEIDALYRFKTEPAPAGH